MIYQETFSLKNPWNFSVYQQKFLIFLQNLSIWQGNFYKKKVLLVQTGTTFSKFTDTLMRLSWAAVAFFVIFLHFLNSFCGKKNTNMKTKIRICFFVYTLSGFYFPLYGFYCMSTYLEKLQIDVKASWEQTFQDDEILVIIKR